MRLLLGGQHPLLRARLRITEPDDAGFVADARRLHFAGPLELCAIVSLAHSAASRGEPVELILPNDPDTASYLQRMDVLRHIQQWGTVTGHAGDDIREDRSGVLLETSAVADAVEAEAITERVVPLARQHANARVTQAVFMGIGELLDNACTHAKSPTPVYVAAQTYTGETSNRRGLELAVVDSGVGILEHLRRNPRYARFRYAQTAIAHAIQPGVTGTRDRRGYGFSDVLDVVESAGLGRLVLRSGDGIGRITVRPSGRRRLFGTCPVPITGTWAWLRVRVP